MQSCYPGMQLASCEDQHQKRERGFASFCSLCDARALPASKPPSPPDSLTRSAAAHPLPWKTKAACELWGVSRSFRAASARDLRCAACSRLSSWSNQDSPWPEPPGAVIRRGRAARARAILSGGTCRQRAHRADGACYLHGVCLERGKARKSSS